MEEIGLYDELDQKTLEVILNFKPHDKYSKTAQDEILKLKSKIKKAINLLPEEEKKVIELKYFKGLSDSDIASKLGLLEEEITEILLDAIDFIKGEIKEEKEEVLEHVKKDVNNAITDLKQGKNLEQISQITKFSTIIFIISIFFLSMFFLTKYFEKQIPFVNLYLDDLNSAFNVQVLKIGSNNFFKDKSKFYNIDPNTIKITGSTSLLALSQRWENAFSIEHPDYMLQLYSTDSDQGIDELINGNVSIGNLSRPISFLDYKKARSKDLELVENKVAIDALVVIVNSMNSIKELTLDNVTSVFSGEIKNWQDLNGPNISILPLVREKGSGTSEFIMSRILQGDEFPSLLIKKNSNEEIINIISMNEGAISCVNSNNYPWGNQDIKYLTIKAHENSLGVSPFEEQKLNVKAIRYGDYPLAHYLYLVSLTNVPKSVNEYINWALSSEAQKIVDEIGLIPVLE